MKETYTLMIKQLDALLQNETNTIGILANASALLFQTLPDLNWAGFYLYDLHTDTLILGPFQGKIACMQIPMNKGVCGTAAYQQKTITVDDVHTFEGHIACDSASNSEVVIPIVINKTLYGVLDIDSPSKGRFSPKDAYYLEQFVSILKKYIG